MFVLFYSSFVCISAYANVYFKTTITKQNINIIFFQTNIHMSEVHCMSAVRFGQAPHFRAFLLLHTTCMYLCRIRVAKYVVAYCVEWKPKKSKKIFRVNDKNFAGLKWHPADCVGPQLPLDLDAWAEPCLWTACAWRSSTRCRRQSNRVPRFEVFLGTSFSGTLFTQTSSRCMFDVIFVTHKDMMTMPTLPGWTPSWYATIPDLLCVHAVPVLLNIWWWCINNSPEPGTWFHMVGYATREWVLTTEMLRATRSQPESIRDFFSLFPGYNSKGRNQNGGW